MLVLILFNLVQNFELLIFLKKIVHKLLVKNNNYY
jgi:hypothetical protein